MIDVGPYIGFLLTVAIISFAIKDNKLFKFAEYTFIAGASAHALVMGYNSIVQSAFTPLFSGNYLRIIPIVLGLLVYTRFSEKYKWISRYSFAIIVAAGLTLVMRATIDVDFVRQIEATLLPLIVPSNLLVTFNNIFGAVGLICILSYFLYSWEHKGVLGKTSKIGRLVIMLGLGGMFASMILTRTNALAVRYRYLLKILGLNIP